MTFKGHATFVLSSGNLFNSGFRVLEICERSDGLVLARDKLQLLDIHQRDIASLETNKTILDKSFQLLVYTLARRRQFLSKKCLIKP